MKLSIEAKEKVQEHMDAIKSICEAEDVDLKGVLSGMSGEQSDESEEDEEPREENNEGDLIGDQENAGAAKDEGKANRKLLVIAALKKKAGQG
jgi:hypothetical protein